MKDIKPVEKPAEKVWADFQNTENLKPNQVAQFKKYADLLVRWNELTNLTAIEGLSGIVNQHFIDSIALKEAVDMPNIKSICDVGTGAGFPGLALKIAFPHLRVLLIEVNHKKVEFLNTVIEELGLEDVEICSMDWRTFLRNTEGEIELFVTKAALSDVELCRMFKPACSYRTNTVVYWAVDEWQADPKVVKYVRKEVPYKLKRRQCKFVFFGLPPAE